MIGRLSEAQDAQSGARATGRAARFREETRSERMRIADEAQARYGRTVSWGVDTGTVDEPQRIMFTHLAVPVMTRLKQPERRVLDTLAWSVRLVGDHADEWLGKLRAAMAQVDDLRSEGPGL